LGCKENGFSGLHLAKLYLRGTNIARFKKFSYNISAIFIPKKIHLLLGQIYGGHNLDEPNCKIQQPQAIGL